MKFSLFVTLTVFLLLAVQSGEGGRGGGRSSSSRSSSYPKQQWGTSGGNPSSGSNLGGSRSSSSLGGSRSSSSWSSRSKSSSSSSKLGGKSKFKKYGGRLAKAAVVGAGVYAGYKLAKLSGKFIGAGLGYGFGDWNQWREADGMLCRRSNDCQWIDRSMYCQDYELDFSVSRAWFGGDFAAIQGECACPEGNFFDDNQMQCVEPSGMGIGVLIGIIIGALAIMSCCCCAAFCYCMKRK